MGREALANETARNEPSYLTGPTIVNLLVQ